MQEAYRLVSEVEESSQFAGEEKIFETDLRWLLALLLVFIAGISVLVNETVFHESVSAAGAGEGQKERYGL
jgi:hypothetical protein